LSSFPPRLRFHLRVDGSNADANQSTFLPLPITFARRDGGQPFPDAVKRTLHPTPLIIPIIVAVVSDGESITRVWCGLVCETRTAFVNPVSADPDRPCRAATATKHRHPTAEPTTQFCLPASLAIVTGNEPRSAGRPKQRPRVAVHPAREARNRVFWHRLQSVCVYIGLWCYVTDHVHTGCTMRRNR